MGQFQNQFWVKCLAAQTEDGEIQGAMIFDVNRESILESGEGTVSLEYLAVAPRDRAKLSESPLSRGTGTALLSAANISSRGLGSGGRLTLAPSCLLVCRSSSIRPSLLERFGRHLKDLNAVGEWLDAMADKPKQDLLRQLERVLEVPHRVSDVVNGDFE